MAANDIELIRELYELDKKLHGRITDLEKRFIVYAMEVLTKKRCCTIPRTRLRMSHEAHEVHGLPAVYFEWQCGNEGSELQCFDEGQGGLITVQELLEATR